MLSYPITLTRDSNGTYLVGFPDFPEANSVGDNEADAVKNAVDALETALTIYFDEQRAVPLPSTPSRGQFVVTLPALETAKVLLWNEMVFQNISKTALARILDVHIPQVDRLFDLRHSSKIEFVEQAAKGLGKTLVVSLH
jgi:antitoxin HicB